MYFRDKKILFTIDDLCLEYINNFSLLDEFKKQYKDFNLLIFAISNFKNKESLKTSSFFNEWYQERKDWIEIGVHSYNHLYPPDGDRDNQEELIVKTVDELTSFLPKDFCYRSPGFQTTSKTELILKKVNCVYLAHQTHINNIQNRTRYLTKIINTHLYDCNSIEKGLNEILFTYTTKK